MKKVTVISRTIPNKSRSGNYPAGVSVVPTSGGTTIINKEGDGPNIDIIKENDPTSFSDNNVLSSARSNAEYISKKKDSSVAAIVDYLNGIKINGAPVTRIVGKALDIEEYLESDIMNALRILAEIRNRALSKTGDDRTDHSLEVGGDLTVERLLKALGGISVGDKGSITSDGIATLQILKALVRAEVKALSVSGAASVGSLNSEGNISTGTDVLAKGTVHSLNSVVQALSRTHDLTVEQTADIMHQIIHEYISSNKFVSGFLGEGFKVWKDDAGLWHGELDMLTVRKVFTVFELMVQKVVHQGGMAIRSAAGGKITKVTDGGSYWRCEHDSTDDFVANDQVLCQVFTGTKMKRYWRLVTSAGAGYFNLSKTDCEAGSAIPEAGDDVAVLGNRSNTARQKAQIDCAVGADAPYRDDYAGINSYSLSGKLVTRTGNLTGITDDDFGPLSGSGLYGRNVYLKGVFRLLSGKTVEDYATRLMEDAKSHADARIRETETRFEVREGQISSKVAEVNRKAAEVDTNAFNADKSAKAAKASETNAGASAATVAAKLISVSEKESSINQTAGQISTQVREVNTKVAEAKVSAANAGKSEAAALASANSAKNSADIAAAKLVTVTQKESSINQTESRINTKVSEVITKASQAAASASNAAGSAGAAASALQAVTTKQSEINQTAGRVSIQVAEVTNKTNQAINASELAMAMSKGRMLYRDPLFASGVNSIFTYNNSGNGTVSVLRVSGISGNPNGSGYCLRITCTGSASPGFGGFCFGTQTKANQMLVTRIIANIPVGRSIEWGSNSVGDGSITKWLTSTAGTGKWTEYAFKLVCGASGSFSSTNYFYLLGGSAPTASAPLTWYVAYATVFDVTDVDDVPTRDEIKSQFTIDTGGISMLGKKISLAGMVTFSSLDTSAQSVINGKATPAQVAAAKSEALNGAKGYTDQLKSTLKGMAFQDMVTLAKLDTTIIDGGYIKTTLIRAGSITADKINVSSVQSAVVTAEKIAALSVAAKKFYAVIDNAGGASLQIDSGGYVMKDSTGYKISELGVEYVSNTWESFLKIGGNVRGTKPYAKLTPEGLSFYSGNGTLLCKYGTAKGSLSAIRVSNFYTAPADDCFITCTNSSHINITLPASPRTGQIVYIKKDSGGGVGIRGNGKSIRCNQDYRTEIYIPGFNVARLIYDGAYWQATCSWWTDS